MPTWVIFTDPRTFPNNPAYEGKDVKEAAKVLKQAGDEKKNIAIRVRDEKRKVLCHPLSTEIPELTAEVRKLRTSGSGPSSPSTPSSTSSRG